MGPGMGGVIHPMRVRAAHLAAHRALTAAVDRHCIVSQAVFTLATCSFTHSDALGNLQPHRASIPREKEPRGFPGSALPRAALWPHLRRPDSVLVLMSGPQAAAPPAPDAAAAAPPPLLRRLTWGSARRPGISAATAGSSATGSRRTSTAGVRLTKALRAALPAACLRRAELCAPP